MNDAPNPVNFERHILRFHVPVLFAFPIAIMSCKVHLLFGAFSEVQFHLNERRTAGFSYTADVPATRCGLFKTAQDLRNVVEYFVCSALVETSFYFSRRLMKHLIDLGTRLMIRSSRPLDSSEGSGEKDQPIS